LKDSSEWGIRVPLIVISPYVARRGYISPIQRSQGAILNFIEDVFSLPQHALNGRTRRGTDRSGGRSNWDGLRHPFAGADLEDPDVGFAHLERQRAPA